MDVRLVIDMQEDIPEGDEKHDLEAVVERINRLARRVRGGGGGVVFIQHDGGPPPATALRRLLAVGRSSARSLESQGTGLYARP